MGDRTSVTLSVPRTYNDATVKILTDVNCTSDDTFEHFDDIDLTCHRFNEVNGGILSFLDELMKAGIPFDSAWDSGVEYTAGIETCRFTESGEAVRKEVSDEFKNPSTDKLMDLIDNYGALRDFILEHHAEVTSLPWKNQVENSKRYRLKELISKTDPQ